MLRDCGGVNALPHLRAAAADRDVLSWQAIEKATVNFDRTYGLRIREAAQFPSLENLRN